MSTTWLISGPPGCGKTTWILKTLRDHPGPCGYLRLKGTSHEGLEQGRDAGIDRTWLQDQIPTLQDLSAPQQSSSAADQINLIELQQEGEFSQSELKTLMANAFKVTWLPEEDKVAYLTKLDAYQ